MRSSSAGGGYTIGDFVSWLAPDYASLRKPPLWPPDVFAICASLLAHSGGYRHVAQDWPPDGPGSWEEKIQEVGKQWQENYSLGKPPTEIETWWKKLRRNQGCELAELSEKRSLCMALIELCAAADSTCAVLDSTLWKDYSQDLAVQLVDSIEESSRSAFGATLCSSKIHPFRVRVLPRCRTPQRGLTIRSLSHNLALIRGNEVIPRWRELPPNLASEDSDRKVLNVLLAPWPLTISRRCFRPAPRNRGQLSNLAPSFRFFDFDPHPGRGTADVVDWLERLYLTALEEVPKVDLVVLPECSLDPEEEVRVLDWARGNGLRIIAGVGSSGTGDRLGENYVVIGDPILANKDQGRQRKHHRWLLDRNQIEAYGLGAYLDPRYKWWEPLELKERSLELITLAQDNLTICALVCEDLTQQEPVSELIRAVGPNLVVALLMDGPQLATRWPARYAAVLADDPGSSVLTLTSLGMCERSKPFGKSPSRAIGLWRDGCSGALHELVLSPGAEGIVLNLLLETAKEYSADGRSDHGHVVNPKFVGSVEINPNDRAHLSKRRARISRRRS